LAGFQGVYERFQADSLKACKFRLTLLYLLSRGVFSLFVFEVVSTSTPILHTQPLWRAVVCGTGAEAILRSKIYFTRVAKGGGNFEEWSKGPLDLLRFYQDFCLTTVENDFAKPTVARVEMSAANWATFAEMYDVFEQNILAYPAERADVKEAKKAAQNLYAQFGKHDDRNDSKTDNKYRHMLCYVVVNNLGIDELETVFGAAQRSRPR